MLTEARARRWDLRDGEPLRRLREQRAALDKTNVTLGAWVMAGLACPFLTEVQDCAVYAARPACCRLYCVATLPEDCDTRTVADVGVLDLGGATARSLITMMHLSAEVGLLSCGFSPMPVALHLASVLMGRGVVAVNEELRADVMDSDLRLGLRWSYLAVPQRRAS